MWILGLKGLRNILTAPQWGKGKNKKIGEPSKPSGSKSNIVYYNKREQVLRILQLYVLRKTSFRILREYHPSSKVQCNP